ncbi:MAG TPA: DUF6569 family protein, partial [Chlamydiales bacterium]|nr:DUF6569 family protein [Chlamydiales bacterium]
MKKKFLLVAVCLGALAATAQYNTANLSMQSDETMTKFTWKNMRIYPVHAKESFVRIHRDVGKYTTLSDALTKKKLVITESKAGEEVNKLYAENVSNDTIMILGGEVISGGKQDRMIASDIIIPPKSGKKDLSVFCVEHGRWNYNGLRSSSNAVSFSVPHGIANTYTRKAGSVEKNQSAVWEKVSDVTVKNNSKTSTGTYIALDANKDYKKGLGEYTGFFKKILSADSSIIGMVAVTGDSVLGCELFATHPLLMQHADNL